MKKKVSNLSFFTMKFGDKDRLKKGNSNLDDSVDEKEAIRNYQNGDVEMLM